MRFPLKIIEALYALDTPRLRSRVFELDFPAPLGLAAGFDKNGRVVDFMEALGFGFVEIGAVSLRPAEGNAPPRLHRLVDERALINRMGLNNEGAAGVLKNLERQSLRAPLGINLVKTNDSGIMGEAALEDFIGCFAEMSPAASFAVLNLSCPNTADGRTFEEPAALGELLAAVFAKRDELLLDTPVLLKFSPDLTERELEDAFDAAEQFEVDGYVLSNTTIRRDGMDALPEPLRAGGLSGAPLAAKTLERIRFARRVLPRERVLIACGGVDSGAGVYSLLRAGASLVELYTALIYEGPGVCQRILLELLRLLDHDGLAHVSEIIGADLHER